MSRAPVKTTSDETTVPPNRSRSVWLVLAVVLAAVAAGAGGYWWQKRQHEKEIVRALPEMPAVTNRPPRLKERLDAAYTLARTPGRLAEGVEELARLYHANGFRAEAEACWRVLREERPENGRWSYYLADLRKIASDHAEMQTLLDETLLRAPDYAPAWLQKGELAFKSGDFATAERYYRRRLELQPADPYARLGLARVELQAGRRSAARYALEALVRDVPAFPSSHNLLAELLAADGDESGAQRERVLARKAGRFREAEDPWLEELNAVCFDPRRLYVLGTMEYQTGRTDKALEYLRRAVELVPGDPVASEMLGDLYLKLGHAKEAQQALENCIQRSADTALHPVMFVMLSQAHRLQQQPTEALDAAERGLRKWPDAPELLNAKGAVLADTDRLPEAIALYEKALRVHPTNAEAAFNIGAAHAALGQLDQAVAALRRALGLQPRMGQALALLGRIELDTGQMAAAREHLLALHESQPELPQAAKLWAYWHLVAGREAEKRKDAGEAEKFYEEGLRIAPGDADLSASLGVLRLMQVRFPEAVPPLEAYQRARPEEPQAALFLGQAYAAVGRVAEAREILAKGAELAEKAGRKDTAAYCREILSQL